MKKISSICLFLSIVLVTTSIIFAAGNTGACGENAYWDFTNGTLKIMGAGDMYDYSADDEKPWDSIEGINTVIIGEDITSVGSYAFSNTTASSVSIKSDNINIKEYSFLNGNSIKNLSVQNDVSSIGQFAFSNCKSLESLYLNSVDSIQNNAFYNSSNIENIIFEGDNAPSISPYAFNNITTLISYTSSASWNALPKLNYGGNIIWNNGQYFGTCGEGMMWSVSKGVLTISGNGKIDASGIDNNTWKFVEENISSIVITDGCSEIGEYAFYGLSNVESVTIAGTVKTIGRSAFEENTKLNQVTMGDGIEEICTCSFANCASLKEITIPKTIKNISKYVFWGDELLETINICSDYIPSIENNAFLGVNAKAYHKDNENWSEFADDNYGGVITWGILKETPTEHTVTFLNYDETVIGTVVVNDGANATLPDEPEKEDCEFLGWSGNYHNVKKDETVIATFDDDKNVFRVESSKGSIGDEITILLDVDGAVEVCAFDCTMYYDGALELVSYDNDMDIEPLVNDYTLDNGLLINWSNTTNKKKQRDILELTFRIKDTTKKELPITLEFKEVKKISDNKIADAKYRTINGVIKVK